MHSGVTIGTPVDQQHVLLDSSVSGFGAQGGSQSSPNVQSMAEYSASARSTRGGTVVELNVAATPLRVLVVEDTDANRKLLVALLSKLGYSATGVEHGKLCVDLFVDWRQQSRTGEPFDLVLM